MNGEMPSQIGPYQIEHEIGRGGMATVYAALDIRTGREVALKVLLPQFAYDPSFLYRFVKEGKASESLRHDHIVRTYETGAAGGYYYIAMQMMRNGTLLDYVQKKNRLLSTDEIISILSQIASGLDYAHRRGLLHRDLKLSNILMTEEGEALLSDFGVVKQMDGENMMNTIAGYAVGTPAFMAPEQAQGMELDARADVYGLGVIAYTLFTGRLPFKAENQAQLLYKIVHETPLSPDSLNPNLPAGIVPVLNRVLAKEREQRYISAGEFIAALIAGRMYGRKTEILPASALLKCSLGQPAGQTSTQQPAASPRTRPIYAIKLQPRWSTGATLGWTIHLIVMAGLLCYLVIMLARPSAPQAAPLEHIVDRTLTAIVEQGAGER
jgi:serine/threonine-protein kinase